MFGAAYIFITTQVIPQSLYWLWFLMPIWLPLILIELAWHFWVRYVRYTRFISQKYTVLEIKLPQETLKSPAAMEVVLHSIIQSGGEGTSYDRYWEGKTRPWASLEIAAIEGEVHFYIWCFDNQKAFITANIYAQYPEVTVHEIDDYTTAVSQNRDKYDVWACQYEFTKPNAYPIKTYVDYGLSDDPDEEFKVDPLSSLIENLGAVNKEDQIWIQFIARAHIGEKGLFGWKFPDKLKDEVKEEIQKIIDSASVEREDGTLVPTQGKMTSEKKDLIDALSRSATKFPLDVGMRAIQVYPKGEAGHIRRDILKGAFKQFGSNVLNNIKPNDPEPSHWWEDPVHYFDWLKKFSKSHNEVMTEKLFKCFCLRSYFFYPYVHGEYLKPMIMNTEELATLYHFPGSTAKAPALHRIPSKRADAPTNLPT